MTKHIFPIHLLFFLYGILVTSSCTKAEPLVPALSMAESISVIEGTSTQNKVVIKATLSVATTVDVSVKWATSEGTAKANEDFVPVTSGELLFKAGEVSKNIEVLIANDQLFELDEYFSIIITGLKNATLSVSQCRVTIINDDNFKPEITVPERLFFQEGNNTPVLAAVTVKLSGATLSTVNLKWSTVPKSAKPGEDFVMTSNANLVFNPGETEKTINVALVNDQIFEMDDIFNIEFTDITNATLISPRIAVVIVNDDIFTPEVAADGPITPLQYAGMELVWNDEFDGTAINSNWWGYDLGAGGWGNSELQTYTNSSFNSFVANGKLNIVAQKTGTNYTSARLLTKGKKEFKYGRIDIRAKMPYGQGIWPALWMLGGNISQVGWPKCGEIDIMEYLGHEQSKTHGTVHYFDNGHRYIGGSYTLPNQASFHSDYHVFTVVWQENSIRWYVDYQLFYQVDDTKIKFEAFRLPQFFIFNVAVGGIWPGYPDATTVFPQSMLVDYVRVFQTPE